MTIHEKVIETFDVRKALTNLGTASQKPYFIARLKGFEIQINQFNDLYKDLTNFTPEFIQTASIRDLFNTDESKILLFLNDLNGGKMAEIECFHLKDGTDNFYAQIKAIPISNDGGTMILVFVEDITNQYIQNFTEEVEQEIFHAIENGLNLFEKLKLLCELNDKMFFPTTLTTLTLYSDNTFYHISSPKFDHEVSVEVLVDEDEIAYYQSIAKMKDAFNIIDIEPSSIHKSNKDYALSKNIKRCYVRPVFIDSGELYAVLSIFYSNTTNNNPKYTPYFKRMHELLQLIYGLNLKEINALQLKKQVTSIGLSTTNHFVEVLEHYKKLNYSGSIKVFDVTEYAQIIELYGYSAGDELIKQLSARIKALQVEETYEISRLTSASLIVFASSEVKNIKYQEFILHSIMKDPFIINNVHVPITIKCGIAPFDYEFTTEEIIKHAVTAVSSASKFAGNKVVYYHHNLNRRLEREMKISGLLAEALKSCEIEVYFQPKYELYRGRLVSVEALARWNSPILGQVSPFEFISIAERTGLIHDIDLFMLESALKWQQQRQFEGKTICPVAVNISPNHFYHPDFIPNISRLIEEYYADPKYIIIEITENIGLNDLDEANLRLNELRRLGFVTSLDDFGTGFSSLSYLQKFFFSEMKIDRSFTSKIEEFGTYTIIQSIIQIARNLEITVVAEGVETEHQLALLKELGCDIAQGYYFNKPMSIAAFDELKLI